MRRPHARSFALLAVAALPAAATAQPLLEVSGTHHLSYIREQVQDFTVPDQLGATLLMSVTGGDGGDASWQGLLYGFAAGGKGGTTDIVCRIGTGTGELAPGGTVRFIIGSRGVTQELCSPLPLIPCKQGGGGGSGSGILYLPPSETDWNHSVILAAAGGGGGAGIDSGFNRTYNGKDAEIAGTCGGNAQYVNGDDGLGGCGGEGGNGWFDSGDFACDCERGDAGGGAFGYAQNGNGAQTEGPGGSPGFPNGSDRATGIWLDHVDFPWGFGAGGWKESLGGGAGGGGGYSGGGAGARDGAAGGGGCGSVNPTYALDSAQVAGTEDDGDNGFGEYYFLRPANDTPQDAIAFTIGQTLTGTTASGDTQFTLDCDPAGPVCDVWYSYTNTNADCIDRMTLTWSTPNTSVSIHDPDSIFTPLDCSNSGPLTVEVLPGDTIWVRVINQLAPYSITTSGGVVDTDGDGVCDSLDACPSGDDTIDCNHNGIPDCAEDMAHSRTIGQNFDTTGHPYQLQGGAFIDNGQARLATGNTSPVGTLFFDPLNPYDSVAEFVADFDFRIGTSPGQVNEGLAFAMLSQSDFSTWSTDTNYGESLTELGDADRELTVDFDTSGGSNNVIIRRSGSFVPRTVSPSFDLDNAQWHHARITWAAHVITVELTPNGGSPEVVYTEQVGGPLYLSPSIFAFGAGRANPSQTGNTWIDNVRITDLSNDDDCDGDGLPDECDTLGCAGPTNDECSGAIAIGFGDVAFDISNATGSPIGTCSSSDPQDIWYSFTSSCTCPVRIETVHVPQQNGLLFFPTLGLYDTCGGTELACAVDNTPDTTDEQAFIDTNVTEGVPVLIRVAGWLYGRGPGILRISPLNDSDGDGVPDECDICPNGDDHVDSDGDGVPDACDVCPGFDDNGPDSDGDGIPDSCDQCDNSNDLCASATPIHEGFFFGCTLQATADGPDSCGVSATSPDVWYAYTATVTGTGNARTGPFAETTFDTVLAVLDSCGGSEIVSNDDSNGSGVSQVSWPVTAGTTYYIRVTGYGGDSGHFLLDVRANPIPANDACANAAVVTAGSYVGTTLGATNGGSWNCYYPDSDDVWYSYTNTTGSAADVTFSTCNAVTNFDTVLRLYDGCGGAELASNDDGCDGFLGTSSTLTQTISAGQTVLVQVSGYGSDFGDFQLDVSAVGQCPCELDGDVAQVNVFDLLAYLAAWFPQNGMSGVGLTADFNDSGNVDVFDLLDYLSCWFPASAGNPCP